MARFCALLVSQIGAWRERVPFDHTRLAGALSAATTRRYKPITLPFNIFTFADSTRAAIDVMVDSVRWRCTLAEYQCGKAPAREANRPPPRQPGRGFYGAPPPWDERPIAAPDSAHEAVVRNFNVFVRQRGTTAWQARSSDGVEADAYEWRTLAWSPDSKWLAAHRVKPGFRREVHYVESSPEDQIQPKHSTRIYNKPGDVLDQERPVLFEVASRKQIVVDPALSLTRMTYHVSNGARIPRRSRSSTTSAAIRRFG